MQPLQNPPLSIAPPSLSLLPALSLYSNTGLEIRNVACLHPYCNENPIYVFLFWELCGLSPNFHIHVSVSDLYITRVGTTCHTYSLLYHGVVESDNREIHFSCRVVQDSILLNDGKVEGYIEYFFKLSKYATP